ncbi:MAG TPA: hypothetical protein VM286_05820 [Candidatus Thermoplasmatota archaeon]|nr:hypothetical protein [Candidatus Thermoplasmatota archaeon]
MATAFKLTGRLKYVDDRGNFLPGIPLSVNASCSDVAEAKVTFDDFDSDKRYRVLPGPRGSIGVRFVDLKTSADGVDTKKLNLVVGQAPTTLTVRDDQLSEKAVAATTRMQGLDDIVFTTGSDFGFVQKV